MQRSDGSTSLQAVPPGAGVLPVGYRLFQSPDIEEVLASVPKWQLENRLLSRVEGMNQGTVLRLGQIGIGSNRIRGRVHSRGAVPPGHMALGIDLSDGPGRRFGGRPLEGDDVLIGYGGAELDYLLSAHFRGLSITVPVELVEPAVAHRTASAVSFTKYRSIQVSNADRSAHSELWQFFMRMEAALHSGIPPGNSIPAVRFIHADVVDAVATVIGRHASPDNGSILPVWHHRRPVALRAREFMQAYLSEPITLHEICAATRASERTVEYAFRDVYGMGAKKFLKMLRLNHVRHQLRTADREAPSIQEMAQNAGFWHMGNFAADYRRLFGETPTQTVASRLVRRA